MSGMLRSICLGLLGAAAVHGLATASLATPFAGTHSEAAAHADDEGHHWGGALRHDRAELKLERVRSWLRDQCVALDHDGDGWGRFVWDRPERKAHEGRWKIGRRWFSGWHDHKASWKRPEAPVPEPGTLAAGITTVLGLALLGRNRSRR